MANENGTLFDEISLNSVSRSIPDGKGGFVHDFTSNNFFEQHSTSETQREHSSTQEEKPVDELIQEGFPADGVAEINGVWYTDLKEAVDSATDGQTIKLVGDVALTSQLEIGKNLILDLNGKTISWEGELLSSGVILVLRGADLTIKDSVGSGYVKGGAKAYSAIALTKAGETSGEKAFLTIDGGNFEGNYYAVVGNGTRHGTYITINGGYFSGIHENDNLGIYQPQDGTLIINGGEFKGYSSAIEVRSGVVKINGGKFITTSKSYDCVPNGNGTTTTGAALAIAQHTTNKPITVVIKGGEYQAFGEAVKLSVSNPQNNAFDNVKVSGLSSLFGNSVKVPENYGWVSNGKMSELVLQLQETTEPKEEETEG